MLSQLVASEITIMQQCFPIPDKHGNTHTMTIQKRDITNKQIRMLDADKFSHSAGLSS